MCNLDDAEAEEPLVQHDDFVLIAAVVHDVTQRQKRRHVGQDGAPPNRVALVRYQHFLLVGGDGVIQHRGVLILIRGRKVVLSGEERERESTRGQYVILPFRFSSLKMFPAGLKSTT